MRGGARAENLLLSALPPWMIYFDTRLQPVLLHHSRRFIASGLGWRHPRTQPRLPGSGKEPSAPATGACDDTKMLPSLGG